MTNTKQSDRRLLENEAVFRSLNERVQEGFDELRAIAKEDGVQNHYGLDKHVELSFYCECADENCLDRIKMTLDTYSAIHDDNKAFVVVPGHTFENIEDTVSKEEGFWVVRKHETPPKISSEKRS